MIPGQKRGAGHGASFCPLCAATKGAVIAPVTPVRMSQSARERDMGVARIRDMRSKNESICPSALD